MWTWFALKRRCRGQKTRLLLTETSVLHDVIDQSRGKREGVGAYDLHPKTDYLQNQPPTGQQLKRDE